MRHLFVAMRILIAIRLAQLAIAVYPKQRTRRTAEAFGALTSEMKSDMRANALSFEAETGVKVRLH